MFSGYYKQDNAIQVKKIYFKQNTLCDAAVYVIYRVILASSICFLNKQIRCGNEKKKKKGC